LLWIELSKLSKIHLVFQVRFLECLSRGASVQTFTVPQNHSDILTFIPTFIIDH
jgi:hypothetical protein